MVLPKDIYQKIYIRGGIKMIECYFRWCEYHCKDEPFCCNGECIATYNDMMKFTELRRDELKEFNHPVKKDIEDVL